MRPPVLRGCDRRMITVERLTKRYGGFTAVDDVSFTVRPGRVTGFLGPNGAGKSTAMRMIARVHCYAAVSGTHAQPTRTASFADRNVFMFQVANLADGCTAVNMHFAQFA